MLRIVEGLFVVVTASYWLVHLALYLQDMPVITDSYAFGDLHILKARAEGYLVVDGLYYWLHLSDRTVFAGLIATGFLWWLAEYVQHSRKRKSTHRKMPVLVTMAAQRFQIVHRVLNGLQTRVSAHLPNKLPNQLSKSLDKALPNGLSLKLPDNPRAQLENWAKLRTIFTSHPKFTPRIAAIFFGIVAVSLMGSGIAFFGLIGTFIALTNLAKKEPVEILRRDVLMQILLDRIPVEEGQQLWGYDKKTVLTFVNSLLLVWLVLFFLGILF